MALTATSNGTGEDYATLSAGAHFARLVQIIDMGTQEGSAEFGSKKQHKVSLRWEILGDEKRSDGKPFAISKDYTVSLHEKATLRKHVEAWVGKLTAEQEAGFSITSLLGKTCQLAIVHKDNGKPMISTIMACPKGMTLPAGEMPLTVFDLDNRDMDVFNDLPEWMRTQIKASPEWAAGTPVEDDPFA